MVFARNGSLLFAIFAFEHPGCHTSHWIEKGRHRKLITSLFYAGLGFGGIMLVVGALARVADQPAHVTMALTVTGAIITIVFGLTIGVVHRGYAQAEQRKMLARDI